MTRTKLDTPAFADQSVDSRNIADGTIQAQDISGSITGTQLAGSIANDKLVNSSFTISGKSISLGATSSVGILVDWQAVTVADGSTTLTAEAGKGYFLDTNTGVIEVFLPTSPTRGDVIILADYSGTFATNQVIINTGTQNLDSTTTREYKVTTNNSIVELIYVDSNKGWLVKLNQAAGTTPDAISTAFGYNVDNTFITATGGTVTTVDTNFKVHTFTGDGCFVVTDGVGPRATVDYLVIAGGGSGGTNKGGGGGAGGYREAKTGNNGCHTASPTATPTGISVTAGTTYPITVGGGGAGGSHPNYNDGSNSVFSTITSTGGGAGGGKACAVGSGRDGGSGGGALGGYGGNPCGAAGGSGNTPPVSPPQGGNGGTGTPGASSCDAGGGGGSAVANGSNGSPGSGPGGNGAAGATSGITGSNVQRAAGGGGGKRRGDGQPTSSASGTGGSGGGGNGGGGPNPCAAGTAASANTGSGGGAGGPGSGGAAGAGGKGVVIIRYKFQ